MVKEGGLKARGNSVAATLFLLRKMSVRKRSRSAGAPEDVRHNNIPTVLPYDARISLKFKLKALFINLDDVVVFM